MRAKLPGLLERRGRDGEGTRVTYWQARSSQVKLEKEAEPWASKMALRVRVLSCKPKGLGSIPELRVEAEN